MAFINRGHDRDIRTPALEQKVIAVVDEHLDVVLENLHLQYSGYWLMTTFTHTIVELKL